MIHRKIRSEKQLLSTDYGLYDASYFFYSQYSLKLNSIILLVTSYMSNGII